MIKRTRNAYQLIAANLLISLLYWLAADLSLKIRLSPDFLPAIWVSSGLAFAAVLILGYEILPGIFLGALASSFLVQLPISSSIGLAVGVLIESFVGPFLLLRVGRFSPSMDRIADVLNFLFLGVFASTILGSAAGALISIFEPGLSGGFIEIWKSYWVCNALGVLLIAPFILVWSTRPSFQWSVSKILEGVLLIGCTILLNLYVFKRIEIAGVHLFPFTLFTFLIWSAIRLEQHGTATVILIVACITTFETAIGHREIADQGLRDNFYFMNTYLFIFATTGLFLASSSSERKKAIVRAEAGEQALRKALNVRDEFLSIASHELKTPLTSLSLQMQLARRQIASQSTDIEKLRKVFDVSNNQVGHLVALVDDFFDASRIQLGRFTFNMKQTHVSHLVTEVMARFAGQLSNAGCVIEASIATDIYACVDQQRIQQALANLIANAVKYAPASKISVTLKRSGSGIALAVEDTGPGIPDEVQARIFEKFERASSGNARGLGLGLFIVKEIAEGHRGHVRVESRLGQGSRFMMELPGSSDGE